MNSNLANRSATTAFQVTTTIVSNQIENIGIGAVISAGGLFGASSLQDIKRNRQTRPVLQVDQKDNPYLLDTTIDLPI